MAYSILSYLVRKYTRRGRCLIKVLLTLKFLSVLKERYFSPNLYSWNMSIEQ